MFLFIKVQYSTLLPFEEGDVVWVVGEKENVYQLVDQKNEKIQVK